jgi:hypothetical protein
LFVKGYAPSSGPSAVREELLGESDPVGATRHRAYCRPRAWLFGIAMLPSPDGSMDATLIDIAIDTILTGIGTGPA